MTSRKNDTKRLYAFFGTVSRFSGNRKNCYTIHRDATENDRIIAGQLPELEKRRMLKNRRLVYERKS